jgi:single-strand DNA-binding protein
VEFGIAVNRRWTSKEGESKEEVCFVDCRAFGRPAETINKYLHKGQPVFVEGRLVYETWTGQDGSKKSRHRVVVENFQFLGAPAKTAVAGTDTGVDDQPMPDNSGQQGPMTTKGDDIPF